MPETIRRMFSCFILALVPSCAARRVTPPHVSTAVVSATPSVAPPDADEVIDAADAFAEPITAVDAHSEPEAGPGPVVAIPPPALGEHEGVVLAERVGGTVACTLEDGAVYDLRDGERVSFGDDPIDNAAVGAGPVVAQVRARGAHCVLRNASLLRESRLTRGPDGRHAVAYSTHLCEQRCFGRAVVLGPGGSRTVLFDRGATLAVVSFDPTGRSVAVGSRGLAVYSIERSVLLAAGSDPGDRERYTAPAYAPTGRLFVRGTGDDDAVFERAPEGTFARVLAHRGRPPRVRLQEPTSDEPDERRDPDPVRFEPGGSVMRAPFARGRVTQTLRATLTGRPLASE